MKRLISFLLFFIMLFASVSVLAEEWTCTSCGNTASGNFCSNCGSPRPESNNSPASVVPSNEDSTDESSDGYSVTREYTWSTRWGNYYAIVIKNISGSKCGFDIQIVFMDSSNSIIGVSNPDITVCDSGYEVLVMASCDNAFDHVEYSITPNRNPHYNDVHPFVNVSANIVGDKVILSAVNTGTVDAEFVEYYCLYINDNGDVVGYDWGYLVDDDSQLKSGKKEYREESCSEPFSSVEVYFEGRTSKSVVNTGIVEASDIVFTPCDGLEITHEYIWGSRWSNYYALVLKNTSGSTCKFRVQILFYDNDNNVSGVSNPSITVCGDGYEAIVVSSQDEAFDHVSYAITQSKASYYEDVHSFVDITANISGKKAILIAKNNGSISAEFVEYYCLFFDKNGNVIGYDWGYLVDNDSELKPGKTEMREASNSKSFDHVEIYFEGRYRK